MLSAAFAATPLRQSRNLPSRFCDETSRRFAGSTFFAEGEVFYAESGIPKPFGNLVLAARIRRSDGFPSDKIDGELRGCAMRHVASSDVFS